MSKTQTSALKLITSVSAMDKSYDLMLTTYRQLEPLMHLNACSTLQHVAKHKDIRQVRKLMDRMAHMGAIRVNALKAWFEFFGPVSFANDDAEYVKGKETRLGAAMEAPFWQFKPEAPYMPMDVAKSLEQLVKKLDKDSKETGLDHSSVKGALMKLLEAQNARPTTPLERAAAKAATPKAPKGTPAAAVIAATGNAAQAATAH